MTDDKKPWIQLLLPIPEWFDLERQERMLSHDPENREPPEADDTQDVKGITCPRCKGKKVRYKGVGWDIDYRLSGLWHCLDCGYEFLDYDEQDSIK